MLLEFLFKKTSELTIQNTLSVFGSTMPYIAKTKAKRIYCSLYIFCMCIYVSHKIVSHDNFEVPYLKTPSVSNVKRTVYVARKLMTVAVTG
jgi:hypothetical protein